MILYLCLLLSLTMGHSTYYNVDPAECYSDSMPRIQSYHFHVNFMEQNETEQELALNLREKFHEEFDHMLLPDTCSGSKPAPQMCLFNPHTESSDDSPFISGQWGVYVPNEHLYLVSQWFQQHRGEFSVMVHPNSGCNHLDHSQWAYWMGESWHVNIYTFDHDKPAYIPSLDAFYNPVE